MMIITNNIIKELIVLIILLIILYLNYKIKMMNFIIIFGLLMEVNSIIYFSLINLLSNINN